MTDFLYRLVDRSLALAPVAAPLVGGLFAPAPDGPPTSDVISEQSYVERTTDAAVHSDKSRGAGVVAESRGAGVVAESPAGADYQTDAPFEADRFSPSTRMHPTPSSEPHLKAAPHEVELESQSVRTTSRPSLHDSLPQASSREDDRTDENQSTASRSLMRQVTREPTDLASTLISTVAFPPDSLLERRRSPLADQKPTSEFENRRATPLLADEGDGPLVLIQRIEQSTSADGNDRPRVLKQRIHERFIDLDPATEPRSVLQVDDPKRHPEALISDHPNFIAEYRPGDFEPSSKEVSAKPVTAIATTHQDERDEGRERDNTIARRERKRERADSEGSADAAQTSLAVKSGKGGSLKATLAGSLDVEIEKADAVAAPLAKPLRKDAETLDSHRLNALHRQSLIPSIPRARESIQRLDAAIAELEAPPPILVTPRILGDSTGRGVYAADSRSMKHAADRTASRRENENDSASAPTIRVTIGRIEVRAVHTPPPPQSKRATMPAPQVSLEDYLRKRNGGSR